MSRAGLTLGIEEKYGVGLLRNASGEVQITKEMPMDQSFEIDFALLPPELQMRLWVLALDADTSRVNIAYKNTGFVTSLKYNYGGNVEAALGIRRFTFKTGVDPASGDVDFGLVFRGFKFSTSASFTKNTYGVGLGYGARLLPFPRELNNVFNSAAQGLHSMSADISAAPNNPLAWYKMHSNDADVIAKAVSVGQLIGKRNTAPGASFGASLRLKYDPEHGFTIFGGAGFRF